MKPTRIQKIILLLFAVAFIYFSAFHVPFMEEDEVVYDNLFSNKTVLLTNRLVLILSLLTTFSALLYIIFPYLASPLQKFVSKHAKGSIAFALLVLLVGVTSYFLMKNKGSKLSLTEISSTDIDSVELAATPVDTIESISIDDIRKTFVCTSESALRDFKSHMKFYYPDWKIYGDPVVRENAECEFRIQFTTVNPHYLPYVSTREVIIVEISYNTDLGKYSFKEIRGELY